MSATDLIFKSWAGDLLEGSSGLALVVLADGLLLVEDGGD